MPRLSGNGYLEQPYPSSHAVRSPSVDDHYNGSREQDRVVGTYQNYVHEGVTRDQRPDFFMTPPPHNTGYQQSQKRSRGEFEDMHHHLASTHDARYGYNYHGNHLNAIAPASPHGSAHWQSHSWTGESVRAFSESPQQGSGRGHAHLHERTMSVGSPHVDNHNPAYRAATSAPRERENFSSAEYQRDQLPSNTIHHRNSTWKRPYMPTAQNTHEKGSTGFNDRTVDSRGVMNKLTSIFLASAERITESPQHERAASLTPRLRITESPILEPSHDSVPISSREIRQTLVHADSATGFDGTVEQPLGNAGLQFDNGSLASRTRHSSNPPLSGLPIFRPNIRQDRDRTPMSISGMTNTSDGSVSKKRQCHICEKPSPHDAISLVECSTCPRLYHRRCHQKPQIPSTVPGDWQCQRCVKKRVHPKIRLSRSLFPVDSSVDAHEVPSWKEPRQAAQSGTAPSQNPSRESVRQPEDDESKNTQSQNGRAREAELMANFAGVNGDHTRPTTSESEVAGTTTIISSTNHLVTPLEDVDSVANTTGDSPTFNHDQSASFGNAKLRATNKTLLTNGESVPSTARAEGERKDQNSRRQPRISNSELEIPESSEADDEPPRRPRRNRTIRRDGDASEPATTKAGLVQHSTKFSGDQNPSEKLATTRSFARPVSSGGLKVPCGQCGKDTVARPGSTTAHCVRCRKNEEHSRSTLSTNIQPANTQLDDRQSSMAGTDTGFQSTTVPLNSTHSSTEATINDDNQTLPQVEFQSRNRDRRLRHEQGQITPSNISKSFEDDNISKPPRSDGPPQKEQSVLRKHILSLKRKRQPADPTGDGGEPAASRPSASVPPVPHPGHRQNSRKQSAESVHNFEEDQSSDSEHASESDLTNISNISEMNPQRETPKSSSKRRRRTMGISQIRDAQHEKDLGNWESRPKGTYENLIAMALYAAPGHRLHPKGVIQWIVENIPDYDDRKGDWTKNIGASLAGKRVDSKSQGRKGLWRRDLSETDMKSGGPVYYILLEEAKDRIMRWDPIRKEPILPTEDLASPSTPKKRRKRASLSTEGGVKTTLIQMASPRTPKSVRERARQITRRIGLTGPESNDDMEIDDSIQTVSKSPQSPSLSSGYGLRKRRRKLRGPRNAATLPNAGPSLDIDVEGNAPSHDFKHVDLPKTSNVKTSKRAIAKASAVPPIGPETKQHEAITREQLEHVTMDIIERRSKTTKFTAKTLFTEWPEYDPAGFDAEAKIAEIKMRPRRKERMRQPPSDPWINAPHHPAALTPLEGALSRTQSSSFERPCSRLGKVALQTAQWDDTDGNVKSFKDAASFFDLPDNPIAVLHRQELTFRDGTCNEDGSLPRAKVLYKTGYA